MTHQPRTVLFLKQVCVLLVKEFLVLHSGSICNNIFFCFGKQANKSEIKIIFTSEPDVESVSLYAYMSVTVNVSVTVFKQD